LSLEDDLMRKFAGDFVKRWMERLGMPDGEALESSIVSRRLEGAQKKVEERNFEARKSVLDYDEVMDEQRKRVYAYRQRILDGHSCRSLVLQQVQRQIEMKVSEYLNPDYGPDSFAVAVGNALNCQLQGRDFRNMEFDAAQQFAKDEAERYMEAEIEEKIEENLPSEFEETEWNWQALASWSNRRFGTNYRDIELRKMSRDEMFSAMYERGRVIIGETDISAAEKFLEPSYGTETLCDWFTERFRVELKAESLEGLEESTDVSDRLYENAAESYDHRELVYPIITGLSEYIAVDGETRFLDAKGLTSWIRNRFGHEVNADDLPTTEGEMIDYLLPISREASQPAEEKQHEAMQRVEELFDGTDEETTAAIASGGNGALDSIAQWLAEDMKSDMDRDDLSRMDRQQMERCVGGVIDDCFHPEMRRLERYLLLRIVDDHWKSHLAAMDHLRDSVRFKGYAQQDPKVEYKREGMRMFDDMWFSIGERVSELIYRMDVLNENIVRGTFVGGVTRHEQPQSVMEDQAVGDGGMGQAATQSADRTEKRPDPVRHVGPKIGRNDPCPCGSGKKFKSCCMRKGIY
ncbi:MAG: SEC-C metal-binding domain-containing protein, partial [Planctomycetota bacterium]